MDTALKAKELVTKRGKKERPDIILYSIPGVYPLLFHKADLID